MKGEACRKEEVMTTLGGCFLGTFLAGGGHAGLMSDFLVDKLVGANN
jgi:hypothetical protein